jgi:hypothetical protein
MIEKKLNDIKILLIGIEKNIASLKSKNNDLRDRLYSTEDQLKTNSIKLDKLAASSAPQEGWEQRLKFFLLLSLCCFILNSLENSIVKSIHSKLDRLR